jgi:hypothetical protein
MRQRLSLIFTLAAWLFATGSQWDLVQAFAWGRMFATNVQSMSVVEAAKLTFSPEGRCEICHAVSDAKQQQESSATVPGGKLDAKILLAFEPAPAPVVAAPEFSPWSLSDPLVSSLARSAPPVPPPRV